MENKLQKIIDYYGIDKQLIVWIEELSELTKELCKYQRTGVFSPNAELEVTDVQVCLDQIKLAFNYSTKRQKENYEYKINRTLEGIEK